MGLGGATGSLIVQAWRRSGLPTPLDFGLALLLPLILAGIVYAYGKSMEKLNRIREPKWIKEMN
jgi:hypothetical protein